jgi:hypothetical protein
MTVIFFNPKSFFKVILKTLEKVGLKLLWPAVIYRGIFITLATCHLSCYMVQALAS